MIQSSLCSFEVCKLAREKGFDEPCMALWEWYEGIEPIAGIIPVVDFRTLPPTAKQLIQIRPGMLNIGYQPYQNSKGKPWLYGRPTHDLLEEWLRVKHDIHVFTNLAVGAARYDIPPLWKSGFIIGMYDSKNVPNGMAFRVRHISRDLALQNALKTLPNATRNDEEMRPEGLQDPEAGDQPHSPADEKES